jgi:tetratricopeptide (TPR) repeat protein
METVDAVLARLPQLTANRRSAAAVELLRAALAAEPDHSTGWCRLAELHLWLGQADESLDAAKRAITAGERSWGHRLASLALLDLGRCAEAVVSAREAVRRDPADWRGHVTLAEALAVEVSAVTGPTHKVVAEALRVARTAVRLAPDEPRAHEVLGDTAAVAHEWAVAEQSYRDSLALSPDDEVAAKLARIAGRPGDDRKPTVRTRQSRFGRVQRTAVWLVLRRASAWQAVGAFVLLIAGLPEPSGLLVWFGLGLALFVLAVVGHGWLGLPHGARLSPGRLVRTQPLIAASVVLLSLSMLLLLLWTVLLALSAPVMSVLTVVLILAGLSAANSWFGLWRSVGGGR